jgi:hypothetical protein
MSPLTEGVANLCYHGAVVVLSELPTSEDLLVTVGLFKEELLCQDRDVL